jgi:hypothetical protein
VTMVGYSPQSITCTNTMSPWWGGSPTCSIGETFVRNECFIVLSLCLSAECTDHIGDRWAGSSVALCLALD